ncbi:site-2 protease family protein [Aeromicrobium sp.]|uniref:site-2 protease family protein n=1 Tax=Aeromicrobium sp. TaxID=1871063 RepID=UPI0040347E65
MSVPSSPRPAGTVRFGRLAGADLLARPSLLLMGVVLVVLFAPRFAVEASTNAYVVAASFVLALYVSVLVHELAHLAVARSFGMRVPTVTLHLLGGETAIEGESRTPWQELVTSVVGPLASLAIGLLAHGIADGSTGVARDLWWSIGWVNLLVAAFNMLPGLPLDGGRVLRAIIWQVTGSERRGVVATAWIGRLAALALGVLVVVRAVQGAAWGARWWIDVLLVGFVAFFLWTGATAALRGADRGARMNALRADELGRPLADDVSPEWPRLSVRARGTTLLRAMTAHPADVYLLVDDDDRPVGILLASDVDTAYRRES